MSRCAAAKCWGAQLTNRCVLTLFYKLCQNYATFSLKVLSDIKDQLQCTVFIVKSLSGTVLKNKDGDQTWKDDFNLAQKTVCERCRSHFCGDVRAVTAAWKSVQPVKAEWTLIARDWVSGWKRWHAFVTSCIICKFQFIIRQAIAEVSVRNFGLSFLHDLGGGGGMP